jgi:hypothetical protein
MNIIFQIDGGLGKCIMATAVCECIKHHHPDDKLIVVSGYPEVFLDNPWVDRAYAFGQQQYFYEEYIEGQDVKIHAHNPYVEAAHIQMNEHLLKTWSKMFGYQYNGEFPKLYLTSREMTFFSQKYQSEKPLFVIQTNGGAPNQELKYSWARDLPLHVAQEVVDHFSEQYQVVHIRRDDQPVLNNTIQVSDNFRSMCVLLMMSSKRLLIDSFANHACAALHLPSVVCWIGNSEGVFGYDIHRNMRANDFTKKPELRHSYLGKFNIIGDPLEFPYHSERDIFNAQDIIKALEEIN